MIGSVLSLSRTISWLPFVRSLGENINVVYYNLALPESCGFFSRNALSWYLSNPEENRLDTDDMLSVEEYRELSEEEKKAYQYFEYTEPYGSRQILRSFMEAVLARVRAYNDNISWDMRENAIDLSDVRVLILHS